MTKLVPFTIPAYDLPVVALALQENAESHTNKGHHYTAARLYRLASELWLAAGSSRLANDMAVNAQTEYANGEALRAKDECATEESVRYVAQIADGRGKVTYTTEPAESELAAALLAFVARPKVQSVRTVRVNESDVPLWGTEDTYGRSYTIARLARISGIDSLPESLRHEAGLYLNPQPKES